MPMPSNEARPNSLRAQPGPRELLSRPVARAMAIAAVYRRNLKSRTYADALEQSTAQFGTQPCPREFKGRPVTRAMAIIVVYCRIL